MVKVSRAQFLRGHWGEENTPIRPPWCKEEKYFIQQCFGCRQCGDCKAVCPEKIIVAGAGGFPVVDFNLGGCSFCGECVKACPVDAFSTLKQSPWQLKASINVRCLAMKGVECRACSEVCEESAIRFHLVVGCVSKPEIDLYACSGCGDCVSVCPTSAIVIAEEKSR